MPQYVVNLNLDGYDTKEEMEEACDEFIREQLNQGSATYAEIYKLKFDASDLFKKPNATDNDELYSKIDYFKEIKNENNFVSTWSMFEVDDINDKHSYQNASEVVYEYHFGVENTRSKINGDTWLDLYKSAEECIVKSDDLHHIFIEGFVDNGNGTLSLITGS